MRLRMGREGAGSMLGMALSEGWKGVRGYEVRVGELCARSMGANKGGIKAIRKCLSA